MLPRPFTTTSWESLALTNCKNAESTSTFISFLCIFSWWSIQWPLLWVWIGIGWSCKYIFNAWWGVNELCCLKLPRRMPNFPGEVLTKVSVLISPFTSRCYFWMYLVSRSCWCLRCAMYSAFFVHASLHLCMVHPVIANVALGTKSWLFNYCIWCGRNKYLSWDTKPEWYSTWWGEKISENFAISEQWPSLGLYFFHCFHTSLTN